jgi:Cu(I)/Ag(I) efflux system membrane fusion protein
VGRVLFDERRVHHVHTRYEAFVEHVTADFTGKYVHKGEVLAHVYSPELFATQQEYLLALKASRSLVGSSMPGVSTGGKELLEAARQRLLLWQIAPEDIAAIEKAGEPLRTVPLYAPISGYVIARTAYHGMKVMPADTLFDIVDLSSVWVVADVYEYELPRLKLGQKATVTLAYWPGKEWAGPVTYIYPAVDEKSRTVKVRIDVTNPEGDLKPEMFAQVVIKGAAREALAVPDDAVLDSGTRKIVFLSPGRGRLVPREVEVGERSGGMTEIRKGLEEGDTVALGANFLVDSESQLKAALAGMTAGEGAKEPAKEAK